MTVVIHFSREKPAREILQDILLGPQFQHFIPKVADQAPHTTIGEVQTSSRPNVDLVEIGLVIP